jgi:hypothetical protein
LDRQENSMTLEQAIEDIESLSFDVHLNLASGLTHFIQILLEEPAIKTLLSERQRPDVRSVVDGRIRELASAKFDDNYGHPHDTALAAYAWLFRVMAWEEAEGIAEFVSRVPNTWWARKISALEREPGSAQADNAFQAATQPESGRNEQMVELEQIAPPGVRPEYGISNLPQRLRAR